MYLLFNFLEIHFYIFQQNIYKIISFELGHFKIAIFLLLFVSGILTSINPCFLSIIPLSISYLLDYKTKNTFILGLISSFISIIVLYLLLNISYQKLIINIPLFSSFTMIVVGLNILNILKFNRIYLNSNNIYKKNLKSSLKNYVIGFIIGISSASCSTPILINILFWISYSNNLLLGAIYLLFYLIGYITPLLFLIHISINSMKLNFINKVRDFLIPFSGSFMLSLGVFSLLENIFI
uniref:Thiol:disulfide interchange protein n=1 Tax=Leiomenia cribrosa TaxID=217483 RepID=A0A4D6WY88_9FLOR|nr:Thiol:disulfide interchange protein [Leiomenia cribrosa]